MLEDTYRRDTISYDDQTKEQFFLQNHPVIRELRGIPQIVFPGQEGEYEHSDEWISLKDLFQKKNMDLYHVDCLILCRIARKMLEIQEALRSRKIYPGLYDPADIYVDFHQNWNLVVTHPERFQLLNLEQDYEWYPEDERIHGDLIFFDQNSQLRADQRLLYKILIASGKGNVKVPPRSNGQDYAELFYGTLPAYWKDIFEKDTLLSHLEWKTTLDEMIRSEEYYEKIARENLERNMVSDSFDDTYQKPDPGHRRKCLFVILRTEWNHSLEISRLLYEIHDQLDIEQSHGRFTLEQGYLFGDKVIRKKDFACYEAGYRVQIPGRITEYNQVETLLAGCEWMWEILQEATEEENNRTDYSLYIITDGKVENNRMFKECLQRLQELKQKGCQIIFAAGKNTSCEGWTTLKQLWKKG